MKLIPARCPSCGSNIEVNKDKETAKCEYCDTRIIIDDAIAKYKLEVSGNVKIDNLPTALNYLKLGTRNLDKGEFKKAHEQLEKAIELDPDNPNIIIKEALSKSLMTELNKDSFEQLIYSIQEMRKVCEEDLDEHIMYCIDTLEKKRKEISSLLNLKPNKITFEKLIKKYIDFLKFYEMIFRNYISQESNKIYVIRKIFACIQSFNNGGQYSVISNGSIHYISYVPSSDLKAYIDTKTEQYENELVKLDDDFRQQRVKQKQNEEKILQQQAEYKKQKAKEMKSNIPLIIDLILSLGCILFIGLFILVALLETKVVSLIIYGVAIFIILPFILLKNIPQIKKVGPLYQVIIAIARYIVMFILFFIGTILLGELVSPYVGETFISDNLNIEINITQEFVKIVNKEENYTEELFYYEEETEDGYIINIIETTLDDTTTNESKGTEEKVIAQYKYVTEKESLCLFEDKTCKEYYTKIKESQK